MILFEIEPEKPSEETNFLDWLEVRDRDITACAARPSGHAWQVEGEPGEQPSLSCQDCPAGGDDLFPDIHDYLACDEPELIGGREVLWGRPLADDAEPFTIPVHVRIKEHRYASMNAIGWEYDIEVHVTPRGDEAA
ncbi:hypothetical protein [Nonomuraea rubra]|uniref:Uncharacterized protein n=1 Tax=Nonomuraea rubra TaxID=46180 RepID=A0A7X0P6L1_9ACTN|nr:hypothetical protein [Nonomuraea rubra]MBB6556248.1 hypothetical protein [Nonomuraea rubra]